MKALVTGAGGFLGRALVRRLGADGAAVRALVHGPGGAPFPPGVEVIEGDVTDRATADRVVQGCDRVFHLAGVRRAVTREDFLRVNADGTRVLLEACAAAGAARGRFVLAGSLAAAGPSRQGKRESDPMEPAEWYGESKAEAERITLAFSGRIPVAVARPPRIMGPGDRENLLFFRIAARGILPRILGPERPLSWIDVDDCAAGLLALAARPEAVGESFFLASPARTSVAGLLEEISRALGVRGRALPIPPLLLRGAGAAADAFGRLTGRKLPIGGKLARQVLAPGWACQVTKAEERLGFVARTPLPDSVGRAAAWYREQGWL